MITRNKLEEVKKLIKKGFDLDLIAFELDLPYLEITKALKEEQRQNLSRTARDSEFKMCKMREKYREVFLYKPQAGISKTREISPEENDLANFVIEKIEQTEREMEGLPKNERRKMAINIYNELKDIEKINLSVEQLERILNVLSSENLKYLNFDVTDKINAYLAVTKKRFATKLIDAVDVKSYENLSLEELKQLSKKITYEIAKENKFLADSVKGRLSSKILALQAQMQIEKFKNEIPPKIEQIAQDLANGEIDIESAKKTIDEEAKNRLETAPKSIVSLTQAQQKNQVIRQIKMRIKEFKLIKPEQTMEILQKLFDDGFDSALSTVMEVLIENKMYGEAKLICDKFANSSDKENPINSVIDKHRIEIRNAEFADLILKGINSTENRK